MLDSLKSEQGAERTKSDFPPAPTIYPNETHKTATPLPASAPPPPAHSPMDIDMAPASDLALNNIEHISSLEQALCSNFNCCSIQLPDLHALVEHFEEKHVVVFNVDGMRIYPENSGKRLAHFPPPPSLSHTPSSSRSSSVVSSPQTPTTPLAAPVSSHHYPDLTSKSTKPPSPQVYTPFNMSAIPESESEPVPSTYGIGLYDLGLEIGIGPEPYPIMSAAYDTYSAPDTTFRCLSSPASKSHDPMILDSVDSISVSTFGREATGDIITSHDREKEVERKARTKADIVSSATAVSSSKNAAKAKARIVGGNVKRREKAFRCPTHGCIKSYLNPNGLKYHREKGTCRFEDSTDSDAVSENARGTTAPITTPPSPTPTSPSVTHPLDTGGNKIPTTAPTPEPLNSTQTATAASTTSNNTTVTTTTTTTTTYRMPIVTSTTLAGYGLTRPLNTIPC